MSSEHRRAPRRGVVGIERVGGWGAVRYLHMLECGHAESRARASSAPKLGCVMCLRVREKEEELEVLQNVKQLSVDIGQSAGQDEVRLATAASIIAKRFGVPIEAVDIHIAIGPDGEFIYQQGLVFLSGDDVLRLIGE